MKKGPTKGRRRVVERPEIDRKKEMENFQTKQKER